MNERWSNATLKKQKVFAIGFHKTATTSMASALYVLGYRMEGYKVGGFDLSELDGLSREEKRVRVWEQMQTVLPHCDAVQDMPWPVFYRELDAAYPGSKFILTIRETESWLASVKRHFASRRVAHHEWIYGTPSVTRSEDVYRARYEQHNADVIAYFADRPGDLLVFDQETELNWKHLCGFLRCDEPPFPFPRQNQAGTIDRSTTGRIGRIGRKTLNKLTKQHSDFEVALDLQRTSQKEVTSFGSKVAARLAAEPHDVEQIYADIDSTLLDVSERIRTLKDFLALEGPTSRPLAVVSSDSFVETWKWQALDLHHIASSITAQNVRSPISDQGPSVQEALKEIQQALRRCEHRIGTSHVLDSEK